MKKEELIKKLEEIWKFKCGGCLAGTGGCNCSDEKDKMIFELLSELKKNKKRKMIVVSVPDEMYQKAKMCGIPFSETMREALKEKIEEVEEDDEPKNDLLKSVKRELKCALRKIKFEIGRCERGEAPNLFAVEFDILKNEKMQKELDEWEERKDGSNKP